MSTPPLPNLARERPATRAATAQPAKAEAKRMAIEPMANIVGTQNIENQGAETAIVDSGGDEGEGGAGELVLDETG